MFKLVQTFSGIVVAIRGAVGELEEVAQPQADLGGDPRREPLQRGRLQRRDVRGQRVADHAEQRGPVRQLHERVSLAGAEDALGGNSIEFRYRPKSGPKNCPRVKSKEDACV